MVEFEGKFDDKVNQTYMLTLIVAGKNAETTSRGVKKRKAHENTKKCNKSLYSGNLTY